jgi:hypothetical protein
MAWETRSEGNKGLLEASFKCGPCHMKGKQAINSSQNFLFSGE